MTPSQAKRAIAKALEDLIDPPIHKNAADMIWEHFNSCCVYCGVPLVKKDRKGHLDHLIPRARRRGSNHISNIVLACGKCNGDLKRDGDWRESFVRPDKSVGEKQIQRWIEMNAATQANIPVELWAVVEEEESKVLAALNHAVGAIRNAVKEYPKQSR